MLLLKTRWVITVAFALGVGGWGAHIEMSARARAKAFCDWVVVGNPAAEVAEAAQALGDRVINIVRPDSVSVSFSGVIPYSHYVCSVSSVNGKVSEKAYVFFNSAI